jgi:hypothetical protein
MSELSRAAVRYLVIGGYAVAALGLPRFTNDPDLWVHSESQNLERLCRALSDAGVPMAGISEEDPQDVDRLIEMGLYRDDDALTAVPFAS